MIRKPVAAIALAVLSATPAVAWEHVLNDYGNGQVLNAATAYDHTGGSTIIVGCLMGSGNFLIQLTVESSPLPQSTAEAVFMLGGFPLYVPMALGNAEGYLTATVGSDTLDTREIARSIYLSTEPVQVQLEGTTLFFDGGNFSDEALGATLDSCA